MRGDGMSKAIVKYREVAMAQRDELSSSDVIAQVEKIAQIKNAVMRKNEHYGVIPGTQKPTLFKAGAEKLAMTFRFAPKFAISMTNLNHGEHREYSIVCTLSHITSGNFLAEGVGSCSTMETKYRYRKADPEIVGPVPQSYWKENNAAKKADIIGGRGFGVKKVGAQWNIVKFSDERVEHDNPADFYNTALKMAKKRAFVDAVITATGGSDLFTQDVEDDHNFSDTPMPDETLNRKSATPPTVPVEEKKLHGAPIMSLVPARKKVEPEGPDEAEAAPDSKPESHDASASPAPANDGGESKNRNFIDWQIIASDLGKIKLFDARFKALLRAERVKNMDELSGPKQKEIVNTLGKFVSEWLREKIVR